MFLTLCVKYCELKELLSNEYIDDHDLDDQSWSGYVCAHAYDLCLVYIKCIV